MIVNLKDNLFAPELLEALRKSGSILTIEPALAVDADTKRRHDLADTAAKIGLTAHEFPSDALPAQTALSLATAALLAILAPDDAESAGQIYKARRVLAVALAESGFVLVPKPSANGIAGPADVSFNGQPLGTVDGVSVSRELTAADHTAEDLKAILAELRSCSFSCMAGPLANSEAYRALVRIAEAAPLGNLADVWEAIRGERAYQETKWPGHLHNPAEWLLILRKTLDKAGVAWVDGHGDNDALHEIRQLVAVGVACLEQCGAPRRGEPLTGRKYPAS